LGESRSRFRDRRSPDATRHRNVGAPLQVVAPGDDVASDLAIGAVIGASIVPLVLGAVALGLLQRFLAKGTRVWTVVAAFVAVASIASPLRLDVDDGSEVALAVMHLATGAAAILGQTIVHKRNTITSGAFT
jgi:hypothetical protein